MSKTDSQAETAILRCKYCERPIEQPRKGQQFCNPGCRWRHWDKNHPRVVAWKGQSG